MVGLSGELGLGLFYQYVLIMLDANVILSAMA